MTPPLQINDTRVQPRISDYVELYATECPDTIAVVCGSRRVSYREFCERVNRLAKSLLAMGIQSGDRVAMLASPSLEFWETFLATAKIGAIWVGLNPRYSLPECNYVLGDAKPKLLLYIPPDGGLSTPVSAAELAATNPELTVISPSPTDDDIHAIDDFLATADSISDSSLAVTAGGVDTLDPCLIVYTSGSTGQPKGALLTHYGLSFGATMQTEHFRIDRPGLVVAFPINHVASVADTCSTTLVKGGKIVFLPQFDPVATVQATKAELCSMMAGVPTMYQMQLAEDDFDMSQLNSVALFLWGGAAMPADIVERLSATGKRLITAYGMTETATHVTYTDTDATIGELTGSVGRPDPHCHMRIAAVDGDDSDAEGSGEVQVKADFLLAGYWNREAATREAFTADGWFRTGDIGYFREDGNLCLVGRLSDMFKSGGYNVYPREIETVIEAHPAVELAAVVAVPDALYQEVGCAWVVGDGSAELDPESLLAWCRERLANYKVPKSFRVVGKLPLLPVGKVDKSVLRKKALKPG